MKILFSLGMLLALSACSTVPESVRKAPPGGPAVDEVRAQPDNWLGTPVRWGGSIARISNLSGQSEVEIVARELSRDGEPQVGDQSPGRFIAIIPAFIDPAIYAPGRRLTVRGILQAPLVRPLGDMQYTYPQLAVQAYYLWPEWQQDRRSDPFHYSPFYTPWYPYGSPYRDPYWNPFWPPYPW